MRAAAVPPAGRDRRFLLVSALLHGLALAAMVWTATRPLPVPLREQGVALVWDGTQAGAGDAADSAALPGPPAPPAPPSPAPPPPEASAAVIPPPPSVAAPPPAPDVPPPAAPPAVTALPPPPTPPPAPVEAPPAPVAALPPPTPAPPPPEPARPAPPRPRPAQPAPAAAPPTAPAEPPATVWRPPGRPGAAEAAAPLASGAGLASGAVVPARPLSGAFNPSPDYPHSSRLRGEQGSVSLLVQVDMAGRVTGVSVLGSSGFPALDRAAEEAVRRWRFEPGTQDGRPVFATATVGITFRLEGERRW